MPAELVKAGGLIPGLCLLAAFWGGSVAAVYWDLKRRRGLPRREELAWLALACCVPGVGLFAYLLARQLGKAFPLPTALASEPAKRRVTQLRPAPAAAPRTGTIVAADLTRETVLERPPAPPPATPPAAPPAAPPAPPPAVVAAAAAALTVLVIAGPHAGEEFVVTALPARVGRGGEVALRLDRDLGVSREHAELYREAGALRIRDLGSSHGTAVNGLSVPDQALAAGDRIEVGHSALIVKESGA